MSNIALDENTRNGGSCALNTNPLMISNITFNPANHGMSVIDGTGQVDNGNHNGNAVLDENGRSTWFGLSSAGNGQRIIVYANSSGAVLIEKI